MFEAVLFYTFSILAVLAGLAVITRDNAISSAVALVVSFFCLAAVYAVLGAHFVAVIQVLVYAGAIMVLFIFVIMVLNVRDASKVPWEITPRRVLGFGIGGLVGTVTLVGLGGAMGEGLLSPEAAGADFGTIEQLGLAIFAGKYLLPFEVVSALLTVAVVGAVVLAKKEL